MIIDLKIKRFCFLGFALFFSLLSKAQSPFSEEIEFINYLSENEEPKDALYLIRKINTTTLNSDQKDSLSFFKGWIFHNDRNPDSAAFYFNHVTKASPLISKSIFYQTLNCLYAKQTDVALSLMATQSDSAKTLQQLKYLSLAGTHLIKRNFTSFDSIIKQFDFNNYVYSTEQTNLLKMEGRIKKIKRKSPLVAGLLSAAVPGLGKFYAGKKGSALATMATTCVFGLLTAESIYLSGYKSPQTIVFGSLFTIFYMGNIFGSAYSVKIQKRNANNKVNNEIIATLHIPIKRFFN